MKFRASLLPALAAAILTFAGTAPANDISPAQAPPPTGNTAFDDWTTGKYALGEFGGLRKQLEDKGIDLFAYYTTDTAGNPVGGRDPGHVTYTDDIWFGVNLYMAKLADIPGLRIFINGIRRDGHSLTNKYVGSVYSSEQDYGGENIFLYDVALEQLLFDDKFSIKIGRFSASDDFNASPIYSLYMNNGIDGDVRNVLFDTQFSAYPFATWATRLVYYPTKDISLKLGVFQTKSDVFNRRYNGLDWSIDHQDGVFLIGEIGWTPEFFKRPVPAKADGTDGGKDVANTGGDTVQKGLPGHYHIGGSYSPWKGFTRFGDGRLRAGSAGVYAHADQMVYQEKPGGDQGLILWAAGGVYPQESISIVPYQAEGGLVYQGLFPKRDDDKVIVGVIYGKFGDGYADTVADLAIDRGGHAEREIVYEAGYRLQLTKFFYLQPDAQFISRPFGTGRIDDALVVGVQSGIIF